MVLRADEERCQLVGGIRADLGQLDAQQVGNDIERRAEPKQENLDSIPAQIRVAFRHQLDQQHGERTDRRQTASDRQVSAADDIRIKEDEAAQEDLYDEDVPRRDVHDPPEVRPEAKRKLAEIGRHVRSGEVQRHDE